MTKGKAPPPQQNGVGKHDEVRSAAVDVPATTHSPCCTAA